MLLACSCQLFICCCLRTPLQLLGKPRLAAAAAVPSQQQLRKACAVGCQEALHKQLRS
jgi:hypothetical protein